MRLRRAVVLLVALAASLDARRDPAVCGTNVETPRERLFLHRQATRRAVRAVPRNRDAGEIAIVEDTGGIVARQNEFNLDGKLLRFTPSGSGYRYTVVDTVYDPEPAPIGDPVVALDDDDSRLVALPFAFPFYGASYREVYLNSDGNLTFTAADHASSDRSLGRVTAGPPRIAPLFDDLNPAETAGGVRVLTTPSRVVVSWVAVPEWAASGVTPVQTFQVALYPDGVIDFFYSGVHPTSAVVGIAPGGLQNGTTLVDFRNDASTTYTGAVAERFGNTLDVDIVTVAQRFYETHEDAYDYLVIYNNLDIPALPGGVIAYESTVRSRGVGYGVESRDDGAQYGSASRLQAVLNLGPLSQYPKDPNALVPARSVAGDTPLTTIAHEAGHLYLAYASVPDPNDATLRPMLGYQNQHWSFLFNSEASLLEGERIADLGPNASPRFVTTDTVQQYAPMDQYLMGWRAAADVPDTFYVAGAPSYLKNLHPARGVQFDGVRRDVSAGDVARAMGRRTPDHTIAQRHYRFAFVLVTTNGAEPSAADLAQLDAYRQQFESFFATASNYRAAAETTLRRSMKLSLYPAAGVAAGSTIAGTLTVATTPSTDLRVSLPSGSVTIPAGKTTVSFPLAGATAGVQEIDAVPSDPRYETAYARLQVAGAAELKLVQVASDPVVVRLTDANGLRYSGVRVAATGLPAAVTDAQGLATFQWTPAKASVNILTISVESIPAVTLIVYAGLAVPAISAVVNAASYADGVGAGALQTIFGDNLNFSRVELDGVPLTTTFVSDRQINFLVPATTPLGAATLSVIPPSGPHATRTVEVKAVQPGIFGVRRNGDFLEIYCTGIGSGTPTVFVGAVPVRPTFTGAIAPGLYQVNAPLPVNPRGNVMLSVNLTHSNEVPLP
jgi:hypothetical protein